MDSEQKNSEIPKATRPAPEAGLGSRLVLWIAQGLGSGWSPVMPGTAGSVAGIGWLALLLWPGSWWVFVGGTVLGIFASVWFCGEGERMLGRTDPPSVVLDEIIAIPICFLGWVIAYWCREHALPGPAVLFSSPTWITTVSLFVLFRVFDIAKPWPVAQSQSLPGGWGVTVDDVLAAVYVNICWLAWFVLTQL